MNFEGVILFFIGIAVGISFLLYVSQDPKQQYQNCILENIKGNIDVPIASLIKRTCQEKYLPSSIQGPEVCSPIKSDTVVLGHTVRKRISLGEDIEEIKYWYEQENGCKFSVDE